MLGCELEFVSSDQDTSLGRDGCTAGWMLRLNATSEDKQPERAEMPREKLCL
jgi:hypothetical protein